MRTMRCFLFSGFFLLLSAMMPSPAAESGQSVKESDHNGKGLQYYNDAFYRHLPNGNKQEADRLFDLAVTEFKDAIASNPRNAAAYRNLARVYFVKKDFLQAADAFKSVTMLEPSDIDAYLQLAVSYTHIDKFAEAIRTLELAKMKTDDPRVIGKLDEYIRKIRERNQAIAAGGALHD